jgi:hypothetical protein
MDFCYMILKPTITYQNELKITKIRYFDIVRTVCKKDPSFWIMRSHIENIRTQIYLSTGAEWQ